MKRLVLIAMVFLILALGATPAFAAAPQESAGTLDQSIITRAYNMINNGQSMIINNGDGSVTITGYTRTYYSVDKVTVTLCLQKYSSSGWTTLKTYSLTDFNRDYVEGVTSVNVSPGTYRVQGIHEAVDGFESEMGYSYTGSITVN